MRGIKWYRSVLTRIVVLFLIILVPLYVVGIMSYNRAVQIVNTEIKKSMESQVGYYMSNLEKEILRVYSLQQSLISDVYLNRLAAIPKALNNFTKSQAILILQSRIDGITGSSRYIRQFNVYIAALDRVIDNSYVNAYEHESYKRLCELANSGKQLEYNDGRLLMLMPSPYNDPITRLPTFLFEIELDKLEFQNALRQFCQYAGSGAALFYNQDSSITNIISYNLANEIQSAMGENILREQNIINSTGDFFLTDSLSHLNLTLAMYVPAKEVLLPIIKYRTWFWVFTLCAIGMIILFSLSMYRSIYKPLSRLVTSFSQVERGDLQARLDHDDGDEFGFLYKHFNDMVRNLAYQIDQVYTMKILNQKAQLKQLQSQINPHFLYNSFFILNRRIKNNDTNAALLFSHHLGSYFRFLSRSSKDEVMLMQEVDHARIYTEIQQLRFSSRLNITFAELPHVYGELDVPRLILQPIIENAFEHGLRDKVIDGLLNITFIPEGRRLTVVVEDNGEDLTSEGLDELRNAVYAQEEITGLVNIHRRLRLYYGHDSGLEFSKSPLGGLRVSLRITFGSEEWKNAQAVGG